METSKRSPSLQKKWSLIAPENGLDATDCLGLETQLQEHLSLGHTRLVLDLSKAPHMSASVLQVIANACVQLQADGELTIRGAHGNALTMLEHTGLARLAVLEDPSEATAGHSDHAPAEN